MQDEPEWGPLGRDTEANPAPESDPDDKPLRHAPGPTEPGRRIYVNRNLRFSGIDWVGFDMDYTLAPYAKRELERLSFELTKQRMVADLDYPEAISSLPYDADFVARGLAIDKRLGNILKIDRHGYVGRAYHGRRPLDRDARHHRYRRTKVRLSAPRYHWVDTLFSLPEAALYAEIIDLYELELGQTGLDYWKLFDDIRSSIDACHRDGSLKAAIARNLKKYIIVDPELPPTLHKLRAAGKRLFVLTNSEWFYTQIVMDHLLVREGSDDPNWRSYFELVVVEACKPAFFTENLRFHRIDIESGRIDDEPAERLEDRQVYRGGSIQDLAERRTELIGEHVLYVGDHIYGDIIRSKRETLWRSALILEELEDELLLKRQLDVIEADLEAIETRRAVLEDEIMTLQRQLSHPAIAEASELDGRHEMNTRLLLERRRRELAEAVERRDGLEARVDRSFNRYWGSVFREGNDLSRFGRQVEEYACIYTSRVSNLLGYPPTHYFRSPRHWLPHEKST